MKGRPGRAAAVGAAVGHDLLRRRGALILLTLLPGAFYLSVMGEPIPAGAEPWPLYVGAVGIAWAVAGGAFFLAVAARKVDPRLLLAGYDRIDLMAGRVAFLLGFAGVIALSYSVLLSALSGAEWWPLAMAVVLVGSIAVSLGLALASLVPRELEGVIGLVLIVGVQSSVPLSSPVASFLPFYGPMRLVAEAWAHTSPDLIWVAHAFVASVSFLAIATVAWSRSTFVAESAAVPDGI